MADRLLCSLICAAAKASRVARLCRENESLFSLLIQEKGERNNEIDFKTLADVFIQQLVTYELQMFGSLCNHVQGEENNEFTNKSGETIPVELGNTPEETQSMLYRAMSGHEFEARLLSNAAHEEVEIDYKEVVGSTELISLQESSLQLDSIGIWIDPIDCTSQYVKGIANSTPIMNGVHEAGLQCVMILIGVYFLDTGVPVMGVVNQPFNILCEESTRKWWKDRCIWGYCHNGVRWNNLPIPMKNKKETQLIVLSKHDSKAKQILSNISASTKVICSRGAGYKIATVFDASSEAFLYTSDGSYKWDTCGPHAILLSCGGGIVNLSEAISLIGEHTNEDDVIRRLEKCQVKYNSPLETSTNWKANCGGLLVYNGSSESLQIVNEILKIFVSSQSE